MKKKIVCLGDSLTYGYPYGPETSWVAVVAKAFPQLELVNAGVNGDTLEDMANRFDSDVADEQPQAMVVFGGTNDSYSGEITLSESKLALEQIIERAEEEKITSAVAVPMPVDDPMAGPKLEQLCTMIKGVGERHKLPLFDFWSLFTKDDRIKDELFLDGCHPNQEGYRLMGEKAISFFRTYFLI